MAHKPEKVHSVGVIFVDYRDQAPYFLVARRIYGERQGCFTFPGGKIKPGESPKRAAIRETLEETGLTVYSPELLIRTHRRPIIISPNTDFTPFLAFFGECVTGTPRTRESQLIGDWIWISFKELAYFVDHDLLPYALLAEGRLEELLAEIADLP